MWVSLFTLLVCASLTLARDLPIVEDYAMLSFQDVVSRFQMFREKYDRNYRDASEAVMRLQIFADTLKRIMQMNRDAGENIFGINQFADYTPEEFKRLLPSVFTRSMYKSCQDSHDESTSAESFAVPEELDWRKAGVVGHVKTQGKCGSCWAVGATGAIEGAYALKTKKLVSLSDQELVDCDEQADGCDGASSIDIPFQYVIDNGIALEEDYPYVSTGPGTEGECKKNSTKRAVRISDCVLHDIASEDDLKKLLFKYGPLNIAIYAGIEVKNYEQGVMQNCPQGDINHSVLLVGYGTSDKGVPYWLIKNSWGPWGEDGYIRVKRNVDSCSMTYFGAVRAVV